MRGIISDSTAPLIVDQSVDRASDQVASINSPFGCRGDPVKVGQLVESQAHAYLRHIGAVATFAFLLAFWFVVHAFRVSFSLVPGSCLIDGRHHN